MASRRTMDGGDQLDEMYIAQIYHRTLVYFKLHFVPEICSQMQRITTYIQILYCTVFMTRNSAYCEVGQLALGST